MSHVGVNNSAVGDLIKHIIAQMCVGFSIYFCICYIWEIYAVSLASKKFRWGNNPNRNPQICGFCYIRPRSPLQ